MCRRSNFQSNLMVIVSKSQKTKLPFSLPLTSRQVQAAEPQADPFRSATCEHQMYVNQSHQVTPTGHACMLIFSLDITKAIYLLGLHFRVFSDCDSNTRM